MEHPGITHPSEDIRGSRSGELSGRHIVMGITGSIAAVETVKLIRELIRHGAFVTPVMTPGALNIIRPGALEFAAGVRPIIELTGAVEHVALCGERRPRADMFLVAPATANTISKMACGIDDTPVTTFATTAIGSGVPVLVVPAMHAAMYKHPIVKENIEKLRSLENVHVMEPLMEEKKAKFPGLERIVLEAMRTMNRDGSGNPWKNRKVLVISGATIEPVDDMRLLTNRSTGRTGMELCRRAYILGARVELWQGRGEAQLPAAAGSGGFKVRRFESTASLAKLVERTDMTGFDFIINCAAISDYRPVRYEGKLPSGREGLTLEFRNNPKIIELIAGKLGKPVRGGPGEKEISRAGSGSAAPTVLVGFKAESGLDEEELLERATARMAAAGMDMVVANDLERVGKEESTVFIIHGNTPGNAPGAGAQRVSGTRESIARAIFEAMEKMRQGEPPGVSG